MDYNKIAVYGLGPQTRELLADRETANAVVCLLDGYETSGARYGKPIVPLADVPELGVEAILVAARLSSQRIIRKRIRGFCTEHHIAILDARGSELTNEDADVPPVFPCVCAPEEVRKLIDAHDAISFDLFDTLLMRRVPAPFDVFRVVEARLKGTPLAERLSFAEERQRAELILSRDASPDIVTIYREIQRRCALSGEETDQLRELEWNTERRLLLPRRDICALLRYATDRGKRVYIVSDTYYSAAQLTDILNSFGIKDCEKVYASCERGAGKRSGLFSHFLEETGEKSVLHIGDDEEADVRAAEGAGIDALRLPSAYELFVAAGMEASLPEPRTANDVLKTGMLIASLCNSPFAAENGRLRVQTPETVAAFFAPLTTDLTLWLHRAARENGMDTLLLCARDGWLPERLLDMLEADELRCVYFLTSRLSALFSCLKTPQDVLDAAKVPFQGSFRGMLRTRFLLDESKCALDSSNIQDYVKPILNEACSRRRGYLNYLRSLNLNHGRLALFDLISAGTTQLAMEKLTGKKLSGLYLMKTEDGSPDKAALKRQSIFDADSETGKALSEESFLLETVLTSPEPSLLGFDENGVPEYQREYRSKEEIAFVNETQNVIAAYFRDYLTLAETDAEANPALDVAILKLLHRVDLDSAVFQNMHWDDAYYHREIPVEELL